MIRRISNKQRDKNKLKAEGTRELHNWFLLLWDEREQESFGYPPYVQCFETGRHLYRSIYRENTCCYSHLLPKSRYPELAMDKDNVVIVHPDVHADYEVDPEKTPRQKEQRDKIKRKKYDSNT